MRKKPRRGHMRRPSKLNSGKARAGRAAWWLCFETAQCFQIGEGVMPNARLSAAFYFPSYASMLRSTLPSRVTDRAVGVRATVRRSGLQAPSKSGVMALQMKKGPEYT